MGHPKDEEIVTEKTPVEIDTSDTDVQQGQTTRLEKETVNVAGFHRSFSPRQIHVR